MTVTHRRAAATAVALLALTVTSCSDDDDSPEATFTAATEAGDITPADAENASAPTSSAPSDDVSPTTSAAVQPGTETPAGEVEVTVTAPEQSNYGANGIIQTGATDFEMTGDYAGRPHLKDLPSVSWKSGFTTGKCTTKITYTAESGEPVAEYRSRDCEYSAAEGEKAKDYEWLSRSEFPAEGSEAPFTITVSVENDEGQTAEGETTITLRHPNNYRT